MDKKHKRYPIIGVSSAVLVAMLVLAVTIGLNGNRTKNLKKEKHTPLSLKAFEDFCRGVDFEQACIQNLPSKIFNNDHEPRQFLRMGFEAAMAHLRGAAQKAISLQDNQKEPHIKRALMDCSELADMAISDFQRSLNSIVHDIRNLDKNVIDPLVWISGALTYQGTCLDGFLKTDEDVGEHMKLALQAGMESTANALAMITRFAQKLKSSKEVPTNVRDHPLISGGLPEWLDPNRRGLLVDHQGKIVPDLVVAQDGSGLYKTINESLKDIPLHSNKTFVIYIKQGVYNETIEFHINMTNLLVVGDGPSKTRITGNLNVVDGISTFKTATVVARGDYFMAKDIGFENTAGPEKNQAVALRVGSDKSIFYNCQMDGYQDTLYPHTYRQFYRNCVISGSIDFLFGAAAAIFQNCTFLVRKPIENQDCVVTAQARKNVHQPTGFVLQNCTIIDDPSLQPVKNNFRVYIGRPWEKYSRTIIMESFIGDVINPEGFLPWVDTSGPSDVNSLFYTEFNNRGPGSNKDKRVKWPGIKELTTDQIQRFTAKEFIEGDTWLPLSKVPYSSGLIFEPPQQTAPTPIAEDDNRDLAYLNVKRCYSTSAKFTDEMAPASSPALDNCLFAPAPAPGPAVSYGFLNN